MASSLFEFQLLQVLRDDEFKEKMTCKDRSLWIKIKQIRRCNIFILDSQRHILDQEAESVSGCLILQFMKRKDCKLE